MFLVQKYLEISPASIGYFAGILSMSYTLGKFFFYKPVSYTLNFSNTKLVLFFLFVAAAISIMFYGLVNNFLGILICRFISGGLSNSQQYLRSFLMRSSTIDDWPEFTKKALISSRFGILLGISISVFTLHSSDFFVGHSILTKNMLLMGSMCILMLYLIGVMLLLSIEYRSDAAVKAEKYVELPEVKETEHDTGRKDEKYGFEKYIKNIDSVVQDESLSTDEFRCNTERGVVSRPKFRRMQSAFPNISETVAVQQVVKENRGQAEKCTHISYIDEDTEEIEASEQPPIKEIIKEKATAAEVNRGIMKTYAQNYRIVLTFFTAFTVETIPYWLFLQDPSITSYKLGGLLLLIAGIGILLNLLTQNHLLNMVPHDFLVKVLLGLLLFCSVTLAIIGRYFINIWVSVGFLTLIMYCIELLMPVGNILISDSAVPKDREDNIKKSDFTCLIAKSFAALIGPAAVSLTGVLSLNFWISALGFCLILRSSGRISVYFPNTTSTPYSMDA